jgi:uncharacterized protein YdaU (DUF1376 family)
MSKHLGPSMPFFVDDFMGGTMHMGAEEIGAYVLLLLHQWNNGIIEDDQQAIERVARCEYSSLTRVLRKFERTDDGHLQNRKCEEVRIQREWYMEKQRKNAIAGAKARWRAENAGGNAGGNAGSNAVGHAKTCPSNSNSNSNSITNSNSKEGEGAGAPARPPKKQDFASNPPSIDDCCDLAAMIGMSRESVEEFHAYYDSQGWRKGNGQPITNIRSAMTSWKIKGQRYHEKDQAQTGKVDTRKGRLS